MYEDVDYMALMTGRPLKGQKLSDTKAFLAALGLGWEEGIETTVNWVENMTICATASREGKVLKCIGVSPEHQGEGLTAPLITELVKDGFDEGFQNLFLYTKPQNNMLFSEFGFETVAAVKEASLMEYPQGGINKFISALKVHDVKGKIGAIVANCNPFTNGHLYLIEQAAAACDFLYLFILSEDKSEFSASARMNLVKEGTAHIKNIAIYPTGDYLVSSATFPQYFLKNKESAGQVQCELDLSIFAKYFVPYFGINTRFVGTEPHSAITLAYNRQMMSFLPEQNIEVIEIPRKEIDGEAISASRVRALLKDAKYDQIKALVPITTFEYLEKLAK